MKALTQPWPHRQRFPLFVSQDGTPPNQDVAALAHSLASWGVHYLHHMELVPPTPKSRKESLAYYRIANHYKFILQTFFDCFHFPRLIILEVSSMACWQVKLAQSRVMSACAQFLSSALACTRCKLAQQRQRLLDTAHSRGCHCRLSTMVCARLALKLRQTVAFTDPVVIGRPASFCACVPFPTVSVNATLCLCFSVSHVPWLSDGYQGNSTVTAAESLHEQGCDSCRVSVQDDMQLSLHFSLSLTQQSEAGLLGLLSFSQSAV